MSKRFTSGGVGRFTFETANRLLDAADRVDGINNPEPRGPFITPQVHILARLTQQVDGSFFAPASGYAFKVWAWSSLRVTSNSDTGRAIGFNGSSSSDLFDDTTKGLAVCLAGASAAGDRVNLFLLPNAGSGDVSRERWYAFVGNVTSGAALLDITGSTELFPGRYRYQVQPLYIDAAGNTVSNPNLPAGFAFNAYELSGRHGQELEFDDPPSKLIVAGPVAGPVVGVLSSDPESTEIVYVFEAPSPLTPECLGPPPAALGSLLGGNVL